MTAVCVPCEAGGWPLQNPAGEGARREDALFCCDRAVGAGSALARTHRDEDDGSRHGTSSKHKAPEAESRGYVPLAIVQISYGQMFPDAENDLFV